MTKIILTDKELHEKYPNLSLWAINELRRRGQIPCIKLPGITRYFYDLAEIEKWLESLKST
ncbi:MAG: hypothetical protein WCY05_06585 [Candidatus Omnitrophota bacterium]